MSVCAYFALLSLIAVSVVLRNITELIKDAVAKKHSNILMRGLGLQKNINTDFSFFLWNP